MFRRDSNRITRSHGFVIGALYRLQLQNAPRFRYASNKIGDRQGVDCTAEENVLICQHVNGVRPDASVRDCEFQVAGVGKMSYFVAG